MFKIASFRKILNSIPLPSILLHATNEQLVITIVNSAYTKLFGTNEGSILQKHLFNTPSFGLSDINTDITQKIKHAINEAITSKSSISLTELPFRIYQVADNIVRELFISFSISPITNDTTDGVEFILLTLQDDTEKATLKNEKASILKQYNDRNSELEEIENRLLIGRWEIDIETGKIWWSDELFIICGYEPQSFDPSTKQHFSITHPDDVAEAKKTLEQTIRFGTPFSIQRRLIKANGDIVHVLSKGKAIRNDDNEVVKIKGFFQDITQQVVQKEAINTIKTNQEALINSTSDLIWLMDTQMQVLVANNAYKNKMDELAEFYKQNDEQVLQLRDERYSKWSNLIPEILKGNSVTFKEDILNHQNNVHEYALVSINPVKNNQGEVVNIACFAKDITLETESLHTLEATKIKLENIVAASPDVICAIDGNAIFLDVSAASEKVLGYKPEEMIGKVLFEFLHPDDIESTLAEAPKVRAAGFFIHFENRYIKKDGTVINMSWTGSYRAENDILYCVGRDVTEKKKQEAAIEASKKEYQNLFESNPSPMIIWDFETLCIKDANLKLTELFNYTYEEFLALNVLDLVPKEDVEVAKKAFAIQAEKGKFSAQSIRFKKKNGDILLADIEAQNHIYKGKKSSLVLFLDVTEKIKIQKTIAESEAKYRSFFEHSIDGIFITKKSGGILDVNPSGCNMLQMTKEEICAVGRNGILDLEDPRFNIFLEKRQENGFAKGVITHIRKDGSFFEAEVSSSTFTDAHGEDLNALIVRDITERKINETQIKEVNERFNYIAKATSDAIWDWDLNTNHIFWGDGFQTIFGYSKDNIVPTLEFRKQHIHPRDKERVMNGMFAIINSEDNIWEDSYRFMKADGTYAQVLNRGFVIRDEYGRAVRMVGAKRDISQYQYYSDLEKLERNILAINEAGDKSLEEVLSIYLLGMEVLHPGMICSILQLKGKQLFSLAAPSLPEAYTAAINGVFIGENVGSCGTAAFIKKNVIVTDIENDLRWVNYKNIALEHNLKACWSHPILNQKDEVIATFAAYYQHPKTPTALEENTITRANNILKIILESYERTKELKESNERYNYATKATSDAIWDWDLNTGEVVWTEGWQRSFGYKLSDMQKDISFLIENTHPDDVERITASYYKIVKSKESNWVEQHRLKKANGEYAYAISKGFVIRNSDGWAIRLIGATRDITKQKEEELRLKLLESVITNTNDAVLIAEAEPIELPGPRIVFVNEAFTKMTGYTAEEVISKTPRILQGPKSNRNELNKLKEALAKWESCEVTLLNYRKDGSEFWVNLNISPVADETGWYTHWVSIQRDVTENILEEQRLTKAIIKAQENERYEIGGELHDNVCQILTSSQLSLKMLKKALGPQELTWYEKGTEAITLASREIRNLSHRLAPSFFNDTTLELAITTLVATFNAEEKYQIHILFDDKFKALPTKQEFQINLYRIVQEQLKNIFKYAEATVIEIVGTVKSGKLKLEIIDNGLGFDTSKNYSGIGMANMKRRTELFLGKFEVIAATGKGCKIIIEIPIEEVS